MAGSGRRWMVAVFLLSFLENAISEELEGTANETTTTTEKSSHDKGLLGLDQQVENIGITVLGALVFLISACIAGCISRRQAAAAEANNV